MLAMRHRLAAAGVVETVIMPKGCARRVLQHRLDALQVDVALERMHQRGLQAPAMTRSTARRRGTEVGARGVEVAVVGHHQVAALQTAVNSTFSAARPWWVGTKCGMPVMSLITFSSR